MREDGQQLVEDDREHVAAGEEACSSRVVHRPAGKRSLDVQRGKGDQGDPLVVLVGTWEWHT